MNSMNSMNWIYRKCIKQAMREGNFYQCLLMIYLFVQTTKGYEIPTTKANQTTTINPRYITKTITNHDSDTTQTFKTSSPSSSASASLSPLSLTSISPTVEATLNITTVMSSVKPLNSALMSTNTTEVKHIEGSNGSEIYDLCTNGIKSIFIDTENGNTIVRSETELVKIIEGDIILSILTTDLISAMFVINRINVANLVDADIEIGVRAIYIDDEQIVENLLIQEVQYQQYCLKYPLGIFIDYDYYKILEHVINDLEYNIWPIPSINNDIFPKVSHLLYQMPWGDQIASVEIFTKNLQIYNDFMEATRREHMCLMHFKSDHNVYILIGNDIMNHFKENGTIFVVPTKRIHKHFITDLPNEAYVLMENEINLNIIDHNTSEVTLDEILIGESVVPSRILAISRPLLQMIQWLKNSLQKHCHHRENAYILDNCLHFLSENWKQSQYLSSHQSITEIMELMRMRRLTPFMSLQMFQKSHERNTSNTMTALHDEEQSILREIASQNYITNITTYYHYNAENQTSVELKTKFGEIFNCKFSVNENPRYPFLFDGESVMYWRIRSNTWVATGMTAAILGIICTLAILVFILVRISLGDVFEGNPATTVLLLLSLLIVFTSFIPFSMEYIGERRNSHVTFEDAEILTSLCAVKVFILTIVYCFVFSLLLCRAIMLASIGSEGGFLSHVNGYIQAVICVLSVLVQLGMSIQMLIVMHVSSDNVSCDNMYYSYWLFALLAYDAFLLLACIALIPFVYRSQRNYREGILIVIGCVLLLLIWIVWITVSCFGDELRDAAIPLGLQACGWAVLIGILIPRTFLIVRGIERSDIAQALPSLTSLAFAHNNQYSSDQSVYECVNPAMRNYSQDENPHYNQSPSEVPTLPLRGGINKRQQIFANLRQSRGNGGGMNRQNTTRVQKGSPTHSCESSLQISPEHNKTTRF